MKQHRNFVINALIGGLLVVLPIYLAVLLLLLKAMKSVAGLVRPIAAIFPEWMPAENLLALLAVLVISFSRRRRRTYQGGASRPGAPGDIAL